MRDYKVPLFLKMQKYQLENEQHKVLFGVAIHFGLLRREICISSTWSAFHHSLKRFLERGLNHYLNLQFPNLTHIANSFGLNINFWSFYQDPRCCPQSRNPHLVRKIHSNYNYYGSIHFILKNEAIEHFIIQPELYGLNREMTINFKQALAEYCELQIDEVAEKWMSNEIRLPRDEMKLKSIFGIGLELWSRKAKKISREVNDVVPTLIFKSRFKNHMKLMVDTWSEERTNINIQDQFTITHIKLYQCPKNYCLYASSNRFNFDRHCETCSDETLVDFDQRNLLEGDIVKWLIEEKFLSERPKIDARHAHYDIETLLRPAQSVSGKTTCFGDQRVVSIGVCDNLLGNVRNQIFARENLNEESLNIMINNFWSYLLNLRDEFRQSLPLEVNNAFFKIQELLNPSTTDVFGKKITPPISDPLKLTLRKAYNYLDGLRALKIVGWNSENFDLKILLPELLKTFESHNRTGDINLDIIRRGTSVMYLKHNSIIFMDGANFAPGLSLEKAGQTFGATVHKSAFPYEFFTDLDSMKKTTQWPDYSAFKSTLRPYVIDEADDKLKLAIEKAIDNGFTASQMIETFKLHECCVDLCVKSEQKCPTFRIVNNSSFTLDPLLYVESMLLFNDLQAQGEIHSLHDYLLYYNLRDCQVGLETFTNMNKIFMEQFEVSLLNNFSIPSVSLKILWAFYDRTKNSPYSFGPNFPELPKKIRERCYGGLSGPIQSRHLEANGDDGKYPNFVTRAPNGLKYTCITVEDVTSLYGYAMSMNLPGGPGIYYQKKEDKFKLSSLLPVNGWSMKAVHWLEWLQQTHYKKSKIRHALNGGEESEVLEGVRFKPDGMTIVDGVKHYLMFNGCIFHRCTCEASLRNPTSEKQYERDQKIKKLCSKYGVYKEIFECEWDKMKINMEENEVSCFFGRLRKKQMVSEAQIFEKVENGKFYGFLCCDLHSPPKVVKRWNQLGWPTIPTHVTPTEDMIQPAIAEELKKRKTPIAEDQLTLVYNEKEYILTTDLYLFYKKIGMKIKNLTWAIEYTKDTPVKNFIETMTQHRKDAERSGNKALVALYKLIVNSSYGSFGMNVKNHKDHDYIRQKNEISRVRNEGPRIAAVNQMMGEYQTDFIELVKRKARVKDRTAVHFSFAILQNAKLKMMQIVDAFLEHLDCSAMQIAYSDTATTKPMSQMAKPGHEDIWAQMYPNIFCIDQNDPDLKRQPGLLKTEFQTSNGSLIALSPKCYSLLCRNKEAVKRGLKGVHHLTSISHEAFERALYSNNVHNVDQARFSYDSKTSRVKLINQQKNALNTLYTKFRVLDNNVQIEPLSINGEFI